MADGMQPTKQEMAQEFSDELNAAETVYCCVRKRMLAAAKGIQTSDKKQAQRIRRIERVSQALDIQMTEMHMLAAEIAEAEGVDVDALSGGRDKP